ncbi:TRADD-N-associated membrane domain-containing protein [Mycolicibacter kumamotonensis]|uniref:Cyanobacterial TRADD-N associated 2 transmembrane domain-containing protein n=1 Tax=Mycolicibacter kumamotonensis TaxID=354243 RepID=A0A7K3LEE9_9MYCO|nr:hypothetical protein [Mycolicibacter kumamotonensis]NDJ90739.1 hypothetical protein [Mycolicibacter kumamotonensis]
MGRKSARQSIDDIDEWLSQRLRQLDRLVRERIQRLSLVSVVVVFALIVGAGFLISLLFDPGTEPIIAARIIGVVLAVLFVAIALGRRAEQAVADRARQIEQQVAEEAARLETGEGIPTGPDLREEAWEDRGSSLDQQELILRQIYTVGLSQASASFTISIIFATIGGALLFCGVGLAIFRAPSDGQAYVSVVSVVAGIVVNLVSSLFFVQSNKTRADMATQGAALREESQEDRRLSGARSLVKTIKNETLQDDVKAKLALQLMGVGRTAESQPTSPGRAGRYDAPRPDATSLKEDPK